MRKENIVGNNVRLGCRVSASAEDVKKDGAASRGLQTYVIPLYGERVRLVERNPMLHSVAEFLKTRLHIQCKVLSEKKKYKKKN